MSTVGQHDETNAIIKPLPLGTLVSTTCTTGDLFASHLTPTRDIGRFQFFVSFAQVGRVSIHVVTSTTSFAIYPLTNVKTLEANECYDFEFQVDKNYSYNLRYSATGSINYLQGSEVG